jgi:aryl-alcohol dehydrogenase-like predicted oxidoreductase
MREIGTSGLVVSALGLGCMGLSGSYGDAEQSESIAVIREAIDLGVNMFDTADIYGPFVNEELLGRALAGRRDEVIVATKFGGAELDDSGNVLGGANGRPEYVRTSVERSLRHLGTDRIDLYYQHRVDPKVPVEETFGALGELVASGKVRYLGICEARPDTIRRAHATSPLSVAAERGYASGALALAWVLAQGPDIVAIPGTRRRLHLAANVESAAVQLDEADLRALGAAVPADEVAGARTSPYDIDIEL